MGLAVVVFIEFSVGVAVGSVVGVSEGAKV
jgi:hypothetical protein